jgi:DNA-binding winged helix-turn-helix (wHTH) protein
VLQFQPGHRPADLASLPGEDLGTERATDAARWVRIYGELLALHEDRLGEREGAETPQVERLLDQLRLRLDEWRGRHLALAGMEFDPYARVLTVAGRTVHLTRREAQLLDFLLERPGQFFTSEALIREAWESERLAPEQVRTYIVRLRRKLEESRAPARLTNKPRSGYSLSLESGVRPARQRSAS